MYGVWCHDLVSAPSAVYVEIYWKMWHVCNRGVRVSVLICMTLTKSKLLLFAVVVNARIYSRYGTNTQFSVFFSNVKIEK